MKEKEIIESIRSWLNNHGYPLEMSVAKQLREAGFFVRQSEFYKDPNSGDTREIDVLAMAGDVMGDCIINFLIECKSSRKKPWVFFTANESLKNFNRFLSFGLLSKKAREFLLDLDTENPFFDLSWFTKPGRIAYGFTQALRESNDNHDLAYKASMSVANATVSKYLECKNRIDSPKHIFTFPIMILDAPIFECYFDNDEVVIKQIESCWLHHHLLDIAGITLPSIRVIHSSFVPKLCNEMEAISTSVIKLLCPKQTTLF